MNRYKINMIMSLLFYFIFLFINVIEALYIVYTCMCARWYLQQKPLYLYIFCFARTTHTQHLVQSQSLFLSILHSRSCALLHAHNCCNTKSTGWIPYWMAQLQFLYNALISGQATCCGALGWQAKVSSICVYCIQSHS